jgi:hypothetical protein
MKKIEAYQCDFCDFVTNRPVILEFHENACFYNPSTRSCISCLWIKNHYFPLLPFDRQDPCLLSLIKVMYPKRKAKLTTLCDNWVTNEIFDLDGWEGDKVELIKMLYNNPYKFLSKAQAIFKKNEKMRKSFTSEVPFQKDSRSLQVSFRSLNPNFK